MVVIKGVLQDELERQNRMLRAYQKKAVLLPKGSVVNKNIRGKEYFYLQYRDGEKVVSKYIPNNEFPVINSKIEERKKIDKIVSDIKKEIKFIEKALKIKI
ncbi:MAG: hypothetical protein APF76_04825 [Desulfitibacter sp. BRH_c19]|nr:MAG: hypothetical protein APF76_04825 [Desulfitibacter sp. BRH_c19]